MSLTTLKKEIVMKHCITILKKEKQKRYWNQSNNSFKVEMESAYMKSAESYLRELEDKLCNKIVSNWEQDDRFETKREMQNSKSR